MPRLVVCKKCRTVDILPIFKGDASEEAADPLLDGIVGRHLNLHGLTLVNQQKLEEGHEEMKLAMVPDDVWYGQDGGSVQKQILSQMREQWTGFEPEIYAIKNTYQEDALACFNQHRRPAGTCIDWHEDTKRLTSETRHRAHVYLCDFCLKYDTEVVTRQGIFPIGSLVGKHELLIPSKNRWEETFTSRGTFQKVEIQSFGKQALWRIDLHRGKQKKSIHTTKEHRWPLASGGFADTQSLLPGTKLLPLKATCARGKELEVPFAIAQGFVFGDGSIGQGDHRPATLTFYGAKDDMLPYFTLHEPRMVKVNGTTAWKINSLPRHWKSLPPLSESRSFLFSWLAGYFAADGTVDQRGVSSISSSNRDNLEYVRSLAAICGVSTGLIRTQLRQGFPGRDLSEIHSISIYSADLPEWFWIRDSQRIRANNRGEPSSREILSHRTWVVDAVTSTLDVEEVFCAIVPGVEAFALADDIMTGNCPVASTVMINQRKAKHMYDKQPGEVD